MSPLFRGINYVSPSFTVRSVLCDHIGLHSLYLDLTINVIVLICYLGLIVLLTRLFQLSEDIKLNLNYQIYNLNFRDQSGSNSMDVDRVLPIFRF